MAYVQVLFDVPPEIMEGLNSGIYKLFGGVVRNAKGEIVYHLKDALEVGEQSQKAVRQVAQAAIQEPKASGLLAKAGAFAAKHKVGVGIGIGLVVAAAGYGIYKLVTSKKDDIDRQEAPTEVRRFNNALNEYLQAIRQGQLTPDKVSELSEALEQLKKMDDAGSIKIELTVDQIDAMVELITSFTQKFAEANNYPLNEMDIMPNANVRGKLKLLQKNLAIQQEIMQAA